MKNKQRGFTLVELTLAMAFIAFLLLFSVSAIWQVMRLYAKGSAIGHINQTGRQLTDEISRAMRFTTPIATNNQRLCANGKAYIWNISGVSQPVNKFNQVTDGRLKFVTMDDPSAIWCKDKKDDDISRNAAKDVLSPELDLYALSVSTVGNSVALWDINLSVGTSGSNSPYRDSGKLQCMPDNQFCAFGNFSTSVYSKGGE